VSQDDAFARTATSGAMPPPRSGPERLGKYRIEQQLGAGGMGVVHAAFDADLERRVAIKLLHDAPGDISRKRLLREARAMARLSHPNVVIVHEVNTIDGRDFVAMEMIDGESLSEWLKTKRTVGEILDVFVAAAHGLAAAHAEGIVHRDFKPHNVLRSRKGRVVVTDFGLARGAGPSEGASPVTELAEGTPHVLGLTATGAIVGTPAYMAPEQWAGGAVGPASDQFAFCVALWEALAGARPFRGATSDELRAAVERGPASLDLSKLPRKLRKVLVRGLARDPAARWPSMEALLAAIARARREPIKNALWFLAIGLAVFVAVNVAINIAHWASAPDKPDEVPLSVGGGASHDDVVKSVVAAGDRDFEVPRASIETLLEHRELFDKDGRLVPSESDAEPLGFKVYAIKPGSIYTAFHVQNGDTIVAIDNIGFVGEHVDDIVRAVRRKNHIVIDLHRKGSPVRLGVTIK
jgi:serine/threonine protein kinase